MVNQTQLAVYSGWCSFSFEVVEVFKVHLIAYGWLDFFIGLRPFYVCDNHHLTSRSWKNKSLHAKPYLTCHCKRKHDTTSNQTDKATGHSMRLGKFYGSIEMSPQQKKIDLSVMTCRDWNFILSSNTIKMLWRKKKSKVKL